jgi:tetratricopeptide (TPR) repeat protein
MTRMFLGAVLVLTLGSCTGYVPHLRVIRANYNVSRGDYQPAIVGYLQALESGEYESWLSYNLGTVYHYLGEWDAAVDRWEIARRADVPDLLFGASFNEGVLQYEQGRFEDARRLFQFALRVEPRSVAAKTNLELTLQRIEAEAELSDDRVPVSEQETRGQQSADAEPGAAAMRMLDYVRRREQQRWRANAESAPSDGARDW